MLALSKEITYLSQLLYMQLCYAAYNPKWSKPVSWHLNIIFLLM